MNATDALRTQNTVILVAEDDPIVRNLVRSMLSNEGYAVMAANDGQEALEICREHHEPIHLLLTDMRMPRMDGLTLAENVRQLRPDIKVVVMSGEMSSVIREKNAFHAFLRQPFVPPTLLECVQRVLSSSFSGTCDNLS